MVSEHRLSLGRDKGVRPSLVVDAGVPYNPRDMETAERLLADAIFRPIAQFCLAEILFRHFRLLGYVSAGGSIHGRLRTGRLWLSGRDRLRIIPAPWAVHGNA